MSGHIHWSKACTQSRLYVHKCTYNDKLRPPTRSASSGQINSIVTLRKWTFTVTADAWHELWAPTQAHYLRTMANDSEEELNSRLLGNTGGGLHVNAMCHLHLPVCLAFSIISFVIHSVAFSLFVSSHICLVSFPRPQSNRFFFLSGRAGLWAAIGGRDRKRWATRELHFLVYLHSLPSGYRFSSY